MGDDEIPYGMTEEQARKILLEKAALETGSQYLEPPPEFAEYIREFSEDRTIIYDEDGNYQEGNVPEQAKEKYWSVNNPNFVFSNTGSDVERNRIRMKMMTLDLVDSMYQVNPDFIQKDPKLYKWCKFKKETLLLSHNQDIQGEMKLLRTKDGEERKLMVTKSVIAASAQAASKEKQDMLSGITKYFSRGK